MIPFADLRVGSFLGKIVPVNRKILSGLQQKLEQKRYKNNTKIGTKYYPKIGPKLDTKMDTLTNHNRAKIVP